VDVEQSLATGHVAAASSALLLGAAVVLLPKGTRTHRVIGTFYGLALVLVNVAALCCIRENTFGVFHGLAVASLVTIAFGLSPLLLGNRSPVFIATHAYCMTWSYAGLVAAGCGQLAVALSEDGAAWVVPLVIGTVLSVSGVVIFGKCRRSSMACWLKQLPTDPRLRVKRARRYSVLAGSTTSPVGFSAGRT
jgi:uncharacterized membrane protein